ncbi:MAG: tetratricopeptide repeat protein [Elusimicrobia bacterium]|nr:tetratricopeptide repeat protein [Elusimicrobiota bacterium]
MSKQWVKEEVRRNEVADVLERGALWVKFHPQQSLWTGLGVAAAALIITAFFVRRSNAREEAWSQLSAATLYAQSGQADASLNQVKALTEAHPSSAASGYGRLLAGDVFFQQAKFKEAAQAYQGALDQPGTPATIPMAISSLALSQEGAGDCAAASASAQRFLDAHQDHFLAPMTHAVLARCLAAQGKPEAKEAFQRIEILYPGTYWEGWAKARKG